MFLLNPLEQFGFRGGAEASKTIIVRPYTRAYHRWTGERAKEREGGDRDEYFISYVFTNNVHVWYSYMP